MPLIARHIALVVMGLSLVALLSACGEEPAPTPPASAGHDDHADHDHAAHAGSGVSVHDIMETLNKGKQSVTKQIGADLAADPTNWDAVAAQMPQYVELTSQLPKGTPEKGDAASWQTLAAAYAASAVAMKEAVDARDLAAAKAAHGAITQSCKPCHDAHR